MSRLWRPRPRDLGETGFSWNSCTSSAPPEKGGVGWANCPLTLSSGPSNLLPPLLRSSPGPRGPLGPVPPNSSRISSVERERGSPARPPSPPVGAAGPLVSSPRLPRSEARRAAARLVPGKCGPESAARGEAWRGGWAPRTSGSRAQWLEGGRTPPARPARPYPLPPGLPSPSPARRAPRPRSGANSAAPP